MKASGSDESRYKVFDRDSIKYTAVFFMFWGHLFSWAVLLKDPGITDVYSVLPLWQNIISHFALICPPVMFFFIADGYRYTRDRKKYAVRLFVFACITQIAECFLFGGWTSSNVIFTLFMGLLSIIVWESSLKRNFRVLLILLITALSFIVTAEWMIFGVLLILFLYIFRNEPKKRMISYFVILIAMEIVQAVILLLFSEGEHDIFKVITNTFLDLLFFTASYLCMTVFYSGKKGKHPVFAKWFFYIFYPLHYFIIWGILKYIM